MRNRVRIGYFVCVMVMVSMLTFALMQYKKAFRMVNGIVFMGEKIDFTILNERVIMIFALYSQVERFKYTPLYTRSLSHWCNLLITNEGRYVIVSPHENNLLRVICVLKPDVKGSYLCMNSKRYKVGSIHECKKGARFTVSEYVIFMKTLMDMKPFDMLNYNCHTFVSNSMKHFGFNIDAKVYTGTKLISECVNEMIESLTKSNLK